jgi:HK97 family phage major capsid protein
MGQGHAESAAYAICTAALEGNAQPAGVDAVLWAKALELARAPGGNELKALAKTADTLRVGNYLALWGDPQHRDLEGLGSLRVNRDGSRGDYFTPETDFESDYTAAGGVLVDLEHGKDPDGVGAGRDTVLGQVDWKSARADDLGLWVERVLNRRNKYMQYLEQLIEAGLVANSSEAVDGAVQRDADGRIVRWPLRRDTLTVEPMEPRMLTANPLAVKALAELKAITAIDKAITGRPETPAPDLAGPAATPPQGDKCMNLIEKIKQLVPGLTDDQYNAIAAVIELAMANPGEVLGPNTPADMAEEVMALEDGQYPEGKTFKRLVRLAAIQCGIDAPWTKVNAPAPVADPKPTPAPAQKSAAARPPYVFQPAKPADTETDEQKATKAIYVARFGDESESQKAIMRGVVGVDYQQRVFDQNVAFEKYLRRGERGLSGDEQKALSAQFFPTQQIMEMARLGMDVREIKTVMVQAQGTLGGYAVPPNVQAEIVSRLPGLTAVRGGGARVIDLINSDSIEAPLYDGGDSRYRGNLRGQWSTETGAPTAQNAKLKMVAIPANVYTYKVGMSQSLVENASNLVQLVQADIADTLGIDEDEAFLVGDGVGKPLGLLPGKANGLSLTEVKSANASALTAAGIKALKRGVASQYRKGSVFVGASDTYGAIEVLTVATASSTYAFPDLSEDGVLLGGKVFESEAMDAVGANKYPLLYGHLSAYWIVQRAGLTIARFQDSNTGINQVEFHVRRLIGGRPVELYKLAVQKVAA